LKKLGLAWSSDADLADPVVNAVDRIIDEDE
jgi:hypothetical protein